MAKRGGKAYYMISAVAQKYNIHPQTLRLYEREGLLKPSRTDGNTRLYAEEDLHELETILALTRDLARNPSPREIDQLLSTGEQQSVALLAMALHDRGVAATSLSGPQAGMKTTGRYGSGVILEIQPERMQQLLAEGQVVIVAGFQGMNALGDVMTLGRGGSDTTAVALAAALGADRCEIYTDVDGIYTADPRIVPEAHRIPVISSAEMAEMAWRGARVMHPRGDTRTLLFQRKLRHYH